MAVGCNHGYWADPSALKGVLEFRERYKPDTRIHLGDYLDTTSFRSGAGTKDHIGEIIEDLSTGVEFLAKYEPTMLFNGNHDIRVYESLTDSNAQRRFAAQEIVKRIEKTVGRIDFIRDYHIRTSVRDIGDAKACHGFMYGENAIRDHAAHFGKCMIAHLHKVGSAPASRFDSPVAYCCGYLGKEEEFDYAARRRAVAQWSQGLLWGEYCDTETMIWTYERNREGAWRLPV